MVTVNPIDASQVEDALTLLDGFQEEIGEPRADDEARARIRDALEQENLEFLVARDGDVPVGLCSLTCGFSTYKASPFALMEDYYVAPTHRGTGVARQLVDAARDRARSKGCHSFVVGVSPGDAPMWEHFGFRRIGVMMAQDI